MNSIFKLIKTSALMLLLIVIPMMARATESAHDQVLKRYTKEHPLIIVGSWNFAPYEFRNSEGEMDGFNIDLVKALLEREGIPYRYEMTKWKQALQLFKKNKVQLYVKVDMYHHTPNLGSAILAPYRICAVHKTNKEMPKELTHPVNGETYGFVNMGYALRSMKERGLDTTKIQIYKNFMDGLYAVHAGTCDYFFDAEEPMKWDIKEMQLKDLTVSAINLPVLNLKFCSKDSALLEVLDRAHADFVQTSAYADISNNWFHPELKRKRTDNTVSLMVIIALIAFMFIAIILKFILRKLKTVKDDIRFTNEKLARLHDLLVPTKPYRDVNFQKEKKKEYDLIAEKFRKIFELAPTCLSLNTADGYLLEANAPMQRLYHLNEQSDEYLQVINLFVMPPLKNYISPDQLHEKVSSCDIVRHPLTGERTYVERTLTPIKDDEGKTKFIAMEITNVTDERALQIEQQELMKKVTETNNMMTKYEEEMAYLFNSSNIYSWTYNSKTQQVSFQTDPSHLLFEMNIKELLTFIDTEEMKTKEVMKNILKTAGNQPYSIILKGKNIFDKTETKIHTYTVSSMPNYDKAGNICGAFGIWMDITNRMDAREKLKQEMELANQSVRMKSMFMASLSHEIRTPLNSIVGFSEILHTVKDEKESKQILSIIDNNCDILLRLINDILAASDTENNLKIEPQNVEFVGCFQEMCQVLKQRINNPAIQFITSSPCERIPARLDMERLQQVLTNFVTNAVKHTKKGYIKVGYTYDGTMLYIYCEDTGAGIPKDKQDMIFDQFVKLNDFVQGTGLGLSICTQIVEMSGGKIGVNSEAGKGSTFWIKIPANK